MSSVKNPEYEAKYPETDFSKLDVDGVNSMAECLWLMERMDAIKHGMKKEITAMTAAHHRSLRGDTRTKGSRSFEFYDQKKDQLRRASVVRVAVQNRYGEIKRLVKVAGQARVERAFLDAAMAILSVNQVKQIWDRAHADEPEIFERRQEA